MEETAEAVPSLQRVGNGANDRPATVDKAFLAAIPQRHKS